MSRLRRKFKDGVKDAKKTWEKELLLPIKKETYGVASKELFVTQRKQFIATYQNMKNSKYNKKSPLIQLHSKRNGDDY